MTFQWFLSHTPLPVQWQTSPTLPFQWQTSPILPLKHAQYLDPAHHSAGPTQSVAPSCCPHSLHLGTNATGFLSFCALWGSQVFLERTVPGQPLWLCILHYGLVSTFPMWKHTPSLPCPALGLLRLLFSQGVLPQILLASSICSSVTASEGPSFKEQA